MDQLQNNIPERDYPGDVHLLQLEGREIILIGTAHISQESVDLVREVIERERPACVCVELDPRRFETLKKKQRWEALDLREVIRKRQLATLLVNLILSSYQKHLGGQLGVMPGNELLEATRAAEEYEIPIELCDRDIRITMRRAWHALSIFRKTMLVSLMFAGIFEKPELSEEELRRIRQQDVLSELMQELGKAMPELKRVLIDERDTYLAYKILNAKGDKVVAVVGAGHVEGMKKALQGDPPSDLDELETIPPVSAVWKTIGWSIPAIILGAIAYIGFNKGLTEAGDNLIYWFLANGICCALGGILALAHPGTILAGFLAAPFTSLTPLIGAGYVTTFVQVYLHPPFVHEFQTVGDDMMSLRAWWQSRLLRIFLVLILTSLGSLVGTWLGGIKIISNIF